MKKRIQPFALAALMIAFAATPNAKAQDLLGFGFNINMTEVSRLLDFQRSLFLDTAQKINSDWKDKFDELVIVELRSTANRYAYALDSDKGVQYVAIRGTANLRNAILDLESWKVRSKNLGINLHRGFEIAALTVFNDLVPRLKANIPIIVSGHSLGAVEAIIVGMLLSKAGYRVETVLASGPPKVTDEEGWKQYASLPVIRVVSAFDPVPFLPPRNFYPESPYTQGGSLLMLLDGPYITVAESSYFDNLPAAFKSAEKIDAHFGVVDHRIWTYCDRAKDKLGGIKFIPFQDWEKYAMPRGEARDTPPK